MKQIITIILAEDHHLVREGFQAILKCETDFTIVGATGDGWEAVRLTEEKKPDVLISDLMMPGLNGLEVVHQVTLRSPRTRVMILSMFDSEAYVLSALRAGAAGYLLKEAEPAELVQAVRVVASGGRYLSGQLSERAIEAYMRQQKELVLDPLELLTDREREIFTLAAHNLTHQEIADRLNISRRTAETHRHNLMRKLGLHNQGDLVRFAIQNGLLPSSSF